MSEEEKEARHLINVLEDKKFTAQGEALRTYIEELNKKIDKLQKENERLKEENFDQVYMKAIADYKDKIREVLKDIYFYYGQDNDTFLVDKIRKELLGE